MTARRKPTTPQDAPVDALQRVAEIAREPLGPDASEVEIMERITVSGGEQAAAQQIVDIRDRELRDLLPRAYAMGHYPTEFARLTRWSRDAARLVADPGAKANGNSKRDPNRTPRPLGRKPTKRAAADPAV